MAAICRCRPSETRGLSRIESPVHTLCNLVYTRTHTRTLRRTRASHSDRPMPTCVYASAPLRRACCHENVSALPARLRGQAAADERSASRRVHGPELLRLHHFALRRAGKGGTLSQGFVL